MVTPKRRTTQTRATLKKNKKQKRCVFSEAINRLTDVCLCTGDKLGARQHPDKPASHPAGGSNRVLVLCACTSTLLASQLHGELSEASGRDGEGGAAAREAPAARRSCVNKTAIFNTAGWFSRPVVQL